MAFQAKVASAEEVPLRPRRVKPHADIVLICNPRAGGRWKELAGILDSEEAQYARRIVTDSVEDIAGAVADLGREAKLVCIYGGDGTIQRVLDRLEPGKEEDVHVALLGGGTMNVTSRWLGFTRSPGRNFRYVVRGYRSGDLLLKEVPLLVVRSGTQKHRAFTFGMGPVVRLLDAYERGRKGKSAAVELAAKSVAAAWLTRSGGYRELLREMEAEVSLDGEKLPYDTFSALFANVTGQINPVVEPFKVERTRESFYTAAYAVQVRELALALPFVVRGWLPVDLPSLLRPWRRGGGQPALPTDPRYVNRPASELEIQTPEPIYTVDGEILQTEGGRVHVTMGPTLKLAVGPRGAFAHSLKAARSAIGG